MRCFRLLLLIDDKLLCLSVLWGEGSGIVSNIEASDVGGGTSVAVMVVVAVWIFNVIRVMDSCIVCKCSSVFSLFPLGY